MNKNKQLKTTKLCCRVIEMNYETNQVSCIEVVSFTSGMLSEVKLQQKYLLHMNRYI